MTRQIGVFCWLLAAVAVLAILINFALIGTRGSNRSTTAQVRPAVVNLNRASLAELHALPHISEAVAQAIIDGRPYSSADDLIRVYGIGPKTLEGIRPYVKVNDDHPQP
ncbi:ComEA family DNA-binding protein [Methyloglobulus sp.]|uniref:ComEA family DNA-binding protein n=1 Tax=Methyloglobulus sp. TaxID=2518622 RepID=UPI00398938FC